MMDTQLLSRRWSMVVSGEVVVVKVRLEIGVAVVELVSHISRGIIGSAYHEQ